jgi:hypothetical protein
MEDRGPGFSQAKSETLSQKEREQKGWGCLAQVIKHLPSKHEALSSNSNPTKTKFF